MISLFWNKAKISPPSRLWWNAFSGGSSALVPPKLLTWTNPTQDISGSTSEVIGSKNRLPSLYQATSETIHWFINLDLAIQNTSVTTQKQQQPPPPQPPPLLPRGRLNKYSNSINEIPFHCPPAPHPVHFNRDIQSSYSDQQLSAHLPKTLYSDNLNLFFPALESHLLLPTCIIIRLIIDQSSKITF